MGVDYVVGLPCPAKSDLSLKTMVDLVKLRNQATIILSLERRKGNHQPPAAITFGRHMQTSCGTTYDEVTVQAALDEAAGLQHYESHCVGCSAARRREPFGCYGSLPYPIPAAVERWLLARLPESLDCTAGRMLRAAIADLGFDGATIQDMRRHPTFFEQRTATQRTWRQGLRRWRLSSDQLLHMMIGLGDLQPSHCAMLALFLGVLPHDSALDLVLDTAALRQVVERLPAMEDSVSDSRVARWASFLHALALAAALDVQLSVDR